MNDELLNEFQLAERLNTPVSTLRSMRARLDREGPPFIKVGRRTVRYSWNQVQKWLISRTHNPSDLRYSQAV